MKLDPKAALEKLNNQKSPFLELFAHGSLTVEIYKPEKIDLTLDSNGWAIVDQLIQNASNHTVHLTMAELEEIVETNNKKRGLNLLRCSIFRAYTGSNIQ